MSETNKKKPELVPPVPNQRLEELARREETRFNSILLKNKDLLSDCVGSGITYLYFQENMQSQIFSVIARYFDKNDAVLTRQAFESIVMQQYPEENGARFRSEYDSVFAEHVSSEDYKALKNNILARYMQRQAYHKIKKYFDLLLNATVDQKRIVEELQGEIGAIQNPTANTFNKASVLDGVITSAVLPEIRDRREHPEKYWGILSGWKTLDDVYHGFTKGRYMVILAMEGGGKTTFMYNLTMNMAKAGHNVAYVTIESNAKDAGMRMLTIESDVNFNRIIAGGKDPETGIPDFIMGELEEAAKELTDGAGQRIHLIQVLQNTPRKVIQDLIARKMAFTPIDVVVIDYLDEVLKESNHPNRPDLDLAEVSSGFQAWGREKNVLMITAQQLKNEKVKELYNKVGQSSEFRVGTADVSGTKKISAAADYIFALVIDQESMNRMYVWATKARFGKSQKRWMLSYDPDSGHIDNLPEDSAYDSMQDRMRSGKVKRRKKDSVAVSASEFIDVQTEKGDEEDGLSAAQHQPPPQTPRAEQGDNEFLNDPDGDS